MKPHGDSPSPNPSDVEEVCRTILLTWMIRIGVPEPEYLTPSFQTPSLVVSQTSVVDRRERNQRKNLLTLNIPVVESEIQCQKGRNFTPNIKMERSNKTLHVFCTYVVSRVAAPASPSGRTKVYWRCLQQYM